MDIEKILSLIGADKLAPELRSQVKELIEVLIEDPKNSEALERLLFLIGANKLDPDTIKTVTENMQAVIDVAAKELIESIGSGEIKRRKINHLYLAKVNGSSGDADIDRLVKQMPPKKAEYRWDNSYGSDPMKENKEKIKVSGYKWSRGNGLSPLSGKKYGGIK